MIFGINTTSDIYTTALSQSNCRNFSCSSINADIKRTAIARKYFLSLAALYSVLLEGMNFTLHVVVWLFEISEAILYLRE